MIAAGQIHAKNMNFFCRVSNTYKQIIKQQKKFIIEIFIKIFKKNKYFVNEQFYYFHNNFQNKTKNFSMPIPG